MTMAWRQRSALVLLATAALLGCAGGARTGGDELRTESDQTDNDRRARVRLELAAGYFGRGQMEVALDEVKLALAARPDLAEGYGLRGLIYGAMGEDRLADDNFQRALQLAPRDGGIKHNYGWFLCQQRRFDEAEKYFAAAVALPQYRDGQRSLLAQGVCLARAGRLREAETALMRVYELDPGNPTVAVNLAEVLYLRGDLERARFYIRRVNAQPEQSNEQTLWLAARIENRLGNRGGAAELGRQLRDRFPQTPQALAFDRGRFDD